MRVLMVEDDIMLTQAVTRILQEHGYDISVSANGLEGLDKAMSGNYDVVVLDVMLPGMDGFTIVQKLRDANVNTPVLMLTAKNQIADKIEGLDAGADDYMTKPFSPAELLAHLRALNRRGAQMVTEELTMGDLTLNVTSHDLSTKTKSINLSFKEYYMMAELMKAQGHVIAKTDLIAKVWGKKPDAQDNNVEAYVSFLRKKLAFLNSTTQIETIRKVGYRLVAADQD